MMPISAEPNWYPNKVIFKSKIYLTQGPDFHSKKKKKKKGEEEVEWNFILEN